MTTGFAFNPFTSNLDLITLTLTPSEITGGSPNTVAGFDGTGALESIPNWSIDTNTGGLWQLLNITPADATATYVLNNFQQTITPSNDLVNLNLFNFQNYAYLVGPNDFNNFTLSTQGLEYSGGGSINYITGHNSSMEIGNGGTAQAVTGSTTQYNSSLTIRNLASVNNVNLHTSSITLDAGSSFNSVGGFFHSNVINTPSAGYSTLMYLSTQVNADMTNSIAGVQVQHSPTADVQGLNAYQHNSNIQSGTDISGGSTGYTDNPNFASGTTANGYTSFGAFPTFDAGSTVNGFNGLAINSIVRADMTGFGVNLINANTDIYTAQIGYVNGLALSPQLRTGAAIANGVTSISEATHFETGSSASYHTSVGVFPNYDSGSSVTNTYGVNIAPNINSSIPNASMLQISPSGSGSTTNLVGINVNLSGVASTGRKVGLAINEGVLNVNTQLNVESGLGVDAANLLVPMWTVQAGSPVTGTTVLGQNFANLLFANDDWAAGPLGVSLAAVGYVGQLSVATGKTVDGVSMALSGGQISGDGTISELVLYNALGALPGTGTPIVTNMYGFKDGGLLSGLATNVWGVHISDFGAENYLRRLAVNTATEKNTSGKTFDVLGDTKLDGDLQVTSLTSGAVISDGSGNASSVSGSNGDVLTIVAGVPAFAAPAATGVTSVALSDASSTPIYSVSGSPVTSTGTLTLTLQNQSANTVFAGPTSGGAAQPTFRSLVANDLPTVPETKGGTNQTTYATGDILYASASNTLSKLAIGTTDYVLMSSGGVPVWSAPSEYAWTGYHDTSVSNWNFTGTGGFANPSSQTNNGNAIVQMQNVNFGTVTSYSSGAAKYPGIVFTPPVIGSYRVSATVQIALGAGGGQFATFGLTDGTDVIAECGINGSGTQSLCLTGVFKVSSITSTTISIVCEVSGGTATISTFGTGAMIRWGIEKI